MTALTTTGPQRMLAHPRERVSPLTGRGLPDVSEANQRKAAEHDASAIVDRTFGRSTGRKLACCHRQT